MEQLASLFFFAVVFPMLLFGGVLVLVALVRAVPVTRGKPAQTPAVQPVVVRNR